MNYRTFFLSLILLLSCHTYANTRQPCFLVNNTSKYDIEISYSDCNSRSVTSVVRAKEYKIISFIGSARVKKIAYKNPSSTLSKECPKKDCVTGKDLSEILVKNDKSLLILIYDHNKSAIALTAISTKKQG